MKERATAMVKAKTKTWKIHATKMICCRRGKETKASDNQNERRKDADHARGFGFLRAQFAGAG